MGVEANEGELVNKGLSKIDDHSSGTGSHIVYIYITRALMMLLLMMMMLVLIVGLELWICQKIITLHRGLLRYSSEGRGKGHSFIVELPLFAQVLYIKLKT